MIEYSSTPKKIATINYKMIEHERCEDAPFVGAIISACNCTYNCPNCFNQKIKKLPTISKTVDDIISEIKSNPFNKGIIFAGLEWSLQMGECIALATEAKMNNLQTIVYTGADINSPIIREYVYSNAFDYIKYGSYKEDLKSVNHIEHGVILASYNQHILKKGEDY